MPNLPCPKPGQRLEAFIPTFEEELIRRTTKLSDLRGRIELIPVGERSSPLTGPLGDPQDTVGIQVLTWFGKLVFSHSTCTGCTVVNQGL